MNIDITPEEIMTWETKKLWNTLNTIKNDNDNVVDDTDYKSIKYGINVLCMIWYFTEEWYEIYPSSRKVKIRGYGKYLLKDFMKEKESRDNMMREIILHNIGKDGIIEGRV